MDSCEKQRRSLSDCRDSLVAYELDDESADRARALVVGVLTDRGVKRPLADRLAAGWVRTGDYLFEAAIAPGKKSAKPRKSMARAKPKTRAKAKAAPKKAKAKPKKR